MPQQRNPLPDPLRRALNEVGEALKTGKPLHDRVPAALSLMGALPSKRTARLDSWIAADTGLYRSSAASRRSIFHARPPSDAERLIATPGLEYLFLFHRDGRLREAALSKVTGGLPNAFMLAAVLWRLNDWAEPVRAAAQLCAARCFPATGPAIVARALSALLVQQASWGRWSGERIQIDRMLAREDVAAHLASAIEQMTTGPSAMLLRHALHKPSLDIHLSRLATTAQQPAVRAAALSALIDAEAQWITGSTWQWIDKSMGVRRRIPVFTRRTLTYSNARQVLIERGVADRSAVVRRVALTGIIRHMLGTDSGRTIARSVAGDRAPSVREKARFILDYLPNRSDGGDCIRAAGR